MSGSSILYSGAMLKSPNYVDSVEKGELVPSITLNKFNTDEEEWTWWELLQIIYKSMVTMDESGNNNPALWRIGREDDGVYLAVTDAKVATRYATTKHPNLPPHCHLEDQLVQKNGKLTKLALG